VVFGDELIVGQIFELLDDLVRVKRSFFGLEKHIRV
jgi:hypothetical protein